MPQSSSVTQGLYEPLPGDSIRVLRIAGSSEDPSLPHDHAIECSLETISLSEVRKRKVSYHALSYVWGSPRFPRSIICNGIRKIVTPNLYEALWHFKFGPESKFLLWVDAICINQDDNGEKQQQVFMMADIYREAEVVHVWLGKDPTSSPLLEQFWENLNLVGPPKAAENREVFERGVLFLNSAEWFTRVWTMQEIVLARSARVHCGFSSVEWDLLDSLPGFDSDVHVSEQSVRTDSSLLVPRTRLPPYSPRKSYRFGKSSAPGAVIPAMEVIFRLQNPGYMQNPSLYDLIRATRDRAATDPRDKIYALLGLWGGRDSLQPMYENSILETYARAAIAIWKEDGWLWLNLKMIEPLQDSERFRFGFQRNSLAVDSRSVPVTWVPDVRGVILGTWCKLVPTRGKMWQYEEQGVFGGFPTCVATLAMNHFEKDTSVEFSSGLAVYEGMVRHIDDNCSCYNTWNQATQNRAGSTLALSEPGEKDGVDKHKFGWLCLLFGKAEPLILNPVYSPARSEVRYVIANRLPYQHYWAAQILRAGSGSDITLGRKDPWAREYNRRMDSADSRWHNQLKVISRTGLTPAFRKASLGEENELARILVGYSRRMPNLANCHLNWIPTTFTISGEPD